MKMHTDGPCEIICRFSGSACGTGRTTVSNFTILSGLISTSGASDPIQLDRVDLIAEKLYTDDQGRQWGFVSYIHAIRDKWFCLDEPVNPDLAGEKRAAVPSGFQAPTMLPTGSQLGVIIGVVCGVAAGTLTAVLILFRRKRR